MTQPVQTPRQHSQTQARDLTPDELERVSGGAPHSGGVLVALGDGSVRNVDAADYTVWRARFGTGG